MSSEFIAENGDPVDGATRGEVSPQFLRGCLIINLTNISEMKPTK
jgi:hypothetical protein